MFARFKHILANLLQRRKRKKKHFTWLLALIPSTLLRPQVECTMARFTLGCATSMSGGSASHWPRRKASTTATSWAATAGWVGTKYLCPTRTKTMREEEAGGGSREGSAESKHETAGVLLLLSPVECLLTFNGPSVCWGSHQSRLINYYCLTSTHQQIEGLFLLKRKYEVTFWASFPLLCIMDIQLRQKCRKKTSFTAITGNY